MTTDPWQRTCKRCGRIFEVALWCREVTYCDVCQAELNAQPIASFEERSTVKGKGSTGEMANGGCERLTKG
ncbi:MAG: hypothetical protein SWH78_10960 [Thermodesulfobacteriota bacterium]|nr:hypothetical protein [Thermodesulfobacteriota bacterium]